MYWGTYYKLVRWLSLPYHEERDRQQTRGVQKHQRNDVDGNPRLITNN